jgi:hypothetical protein
MKREWCGEKRKGERWPGWQESKRLCKATRDRKEQALICGISKAKTRQLKAKIQWKEGKNLAFLKQNALVRAQEEEKQRRSTRDLSQTHFLCHFGLHHPFCVLQLESNMQLDICWRKAFHISASHSPASHSYCNSFFALNCMFFRYPHWTMIGRAQQIISLPTYITHIDTAHIVIWGQLPHPWVWNMNELMMNCFIWNYQYYFTAPKAA